MQLTAIPSGNDTDIKSDNTGYVVSELIDSV